MLAGCSMLAQQIYFYKSESDLFLRNWDLGWKRHRSVKAQECAFLDTEICEKCTAPRALWKGINSRTISDLNNLGDVQFHHANIS